MVGIGGDIRPATAVCVGEAGATGTSILMAAGESSFTGTVASLSSSSVVMLAIDFSRASSCGSILIEAAGIRGLLNSGSCSFFTPTANAA